MKAIHTIVIIPILDFVQVRMCGEHDLTRAQLADVRAELTSAEKLNAELRTKLASTQAQYATVDAARGEHIFSLS